MLLDLRSLFEPVDATVVLPGVSAASAIGAVVVTANANEALSGVSATSALGTVTVTANATKSLTGVSATSALGSTSVTANANAALTGLSATSALGTTATTADANATATGVQAASALGTVTVAVTNLDATILLSGVEAAASLGTVIVTADGGLTQPVSGGGGGWLYAGGPIRPQQPRRAREPVEIHRQDATVQLRGVQARASIGRVTILITDEPEPWELVEAEDEELLLLLA